MPPDEPAALRNCISCKERKVYYDRCLPCSNFTKADRDCVFPNTGRTLRHPRRMRLEPPTRARRVTDLLGRIRRLEDVVNHLHAKSAGKKPCSIMAIRTMRPQLVKIWTRPRTVLTLSPLRTSALILLQHFGNVAPKCPRDLLEVDIMVHEDRGGVYVGDRFWVTL